MTPAEIREFLGNRQALLVHFSTPMARKGSYFSKDLIGAWTLTGAPLSFSTVQAGDTGPHEGRGGTEGSIGMIVDVVDRTKVISVGSGDLGSSFDPVTGEMRAGGSPPTPESCADSIDSRVESNEWYVADFKPIGILLVPPLYARQPVTLPDGTSDFQESPVAFQQVLASFRDQQIFWLDGTQFKKLNRDNETWPEVDFAEIMGGKSDGEVFP